MNVLFPNLLYMLQAAAEQLNFLNQRAGAAGHWKEQLHWKDEAGKTKKIWFNDKMSRLI